MRLNAGSARGMIAGYIDRVTFKGKTNLADFLFIFTLFLFFLDLFSTKAFAQRLYLLNQLRIYLNLECFLVIILL